MENLHLQNEVTTFASKTGIVDIDALRRDLTSTGEGGVGIRGELLDFGDCHVGKQTLRSFTLTNHSKCDIYRFAWKPSPTVSFKPTLGHLHPGECARRRLSKSSRVCIW